MKSIRNIALSALLALGAFTAVTYTSCNKDECKGVECKNGGTCNPDDGSCSCAVGYTGTLCETEIRSKYFNTYRGNGTDNAGGTYTNWAMRFATSSTSATSMSLELLDANNVPKLAFTVKLNSNTTFTVDQRSSGQFTYTGNGTINETTATLTLNETGAAGTVTVIYTFNNMIKQ